MYLQKYLKYQTKNRLLEKKLVQVGGEKPNVAILKGINLIHSDMQPFLDPTFGFLYCESGLINSLYWYGSDTIRHYVGLLYTKHTDGVIRPTRKLYKSSNSGEVPLAKLIGQFLSIRYISKKFKSEIDRDFNETKMSYHRGQFLGTIQQIKNISTTILKQEIDDTQKQRDNARKEIDDAQKEKDELLDKKEKYDKDITNPIFSDGDDKKVKILTIKVKSLTTNVDKLTRKIEMNEKRIDELLLDSDKYEEQLRLLEIKKSVEEEKYRNIRELRRIIDLDSLDSNKFLLEPTKFNPDTDEINEKYYYYAVLGVLWWIANNKESIRQYYEGINDTIDKFAIHIPTIEPLRIEIPPDFSATEFTAIDFSGTGIIPDYHLVLAKIYRHKLGLIQLFNQEWSVTKCHPVSDFPDCGEVVVRNILNILTYTDGEYDVEKLKIYGNDPPTGTYERVISYYRKFNTFSKQSTKEARNKWGEIMSNLPGVMYSKHCNGVSGNKISYDITPGPSLPTSIKQPCKRGKCKEIKTYKSNLLACFSNLLPNIKNWENFNTESKTVICEPNLDRNFLGTILFTINDIKYLITITFGHYSIKKLTFSIFRNTFYRFREPESSFIYYLLNDRVTTKNELYWSPNLTIDDHIYSFNYLYSMLLKDEYNALFNYLCGLNNPDVNRRLYISLNLINFEDHDLSSFGVTYNTDENYNAENISAIDYYGTNFYGSSPLLTNLTHLTFIKDFNQPLNNLLHDFITLTHLTFGDMFDKSLNESFDNLENLTHLTFGINFNQPLNNSLSKLSKLTHLTFGHGFNKSLYRPDSLHDSLHELHNLTHLTFGFKFNKPLDHTLYELSNLTHLTFGNMFNQPLNDSLHKLENLTDLTFGNMFNQPLNDALRGLSNLTNLYIHIQYTYRHPIDDLKHLYPKLNIVLMNE